MPPDPPDARLHVGLYALALTFALSLGPGAPVYWDSFGYVTQSISGHVGGLLLGRPLFILASHLLVTLFRSLGGPVSASEALLRTLWLAFSALSAPLTARLARALGLSHRTALWAGLVTALCPALAHTSNAVLTDAPSMTAAVLAFTLGARTLVSLRTSTAFATGVALGVAVGLREQAAFHSIPLALLLLAVPPAARWRLALAATVGTVLSVGAPVGYVLATQPGYPATITAWLHAMSLERGDHPWGLRDGGAYLLWVLSLGPAAVVCAVASLRRRPWRPALLAVCVPAAVQLLALGLYQDISYSPRYLLAAFPGAVALPAAITLAAWARTRARMVIALAALALPGLIAVPVVRYRQRPLVSALRELPVRLQSIPSDAAVVTGQLCPAVVYIRELARAGTVTTGRAVPAWQQVCPGWRWPVDLPSALDNVRSQGRTVVLDVRPVAWVGPRQQRALASVRAYATAHTGERGVVVWR